MEKYSHWKKEGEVGNFAKFRQDKTEHKKVELAKKKKKKSFILQKLLRWACGIFYYFCMLVIFTFEYL